MRMTAALSGLWQASVKRTLFIWWALTFIMVTVGGAVRNANRSESVSVIFPPPLQRIHIFWEISLLTITFTYAAAALGLF